MYGLIGKKIGHSFSANFFNKKFKDEKIDEVYNLFPLEDIKELPSLIAKNPDLKGLNVTIPYKQEVMGFLTDISEDAAQIGAINVIKIDRKDDEIKLTGYNSDYYGFRESLIPLLRPEIKKALVLGTGGASKAVGYVLKKLGIEVTFVSRTPKENQLSYKDLNQQILDENLLIVNTTPLGMYPNVESFADLPYQFLTPQHVCYDLVYNPEETTFLKKAKDRGATVKNGIEMLHLQAKGAWEIWNK